MYEISKLEFSKWLMKQDISLLSACEKEMIGIIIDHFDDIAQYGTKNGARAKLMGSYIEKLNNKAERSELTMPNADYLGERVKRLVSLTVENFRGFGIKENFEFDKQYTFYHGPNGSGKTSFCEAIEYSALGTIAEASARGITVDKYIVHTGMKKASAPILKCELPDGSTVGFPTNLSEYRFAFIEKNRILNFSHIGAATTKTQVERIASLFGLTEFQSFVHDFTDSFDSRYLTLESDASKEYQSKVKEVEQQQKNLSDLKVALEPKTKFLQELVDLLHKEEIKTAEQAIAYLINEKTGLIILATKRASEYHMNLIQENILETLKKAIEEFLIAIQSVQLGNEKILSNINSVNLAQIFNAITALKPSYTEDVCPVCRTPLSSAVENPFEYAEKELHKFSQIEEAKKTVLSNSKIAAEKIHVIIGELSKKEICSLFVGVDAQLILGASLQATDYAMIDESKFNLIEEAKKLQTILKDTQALKDRIKAYNDQSNENNLGYDKHVRSLQEVYGKIMAENTSVNDLKKNITAASDALTKAEEVIKSLKETADTVEQKISFNEKMVEAYKSVVDNLSEYVKNLPIEMAANLSGKVREYYNAINCDDADFELIDQLRLPVSSNEKILVTMKDGVAQDALQILSEGHVKILGLSILLAKAITENMPFIVFDDIVNAIDDDHRKGVASLLVTYPDFIQTQMILTCHGELFVSTLESYVEDRNKMARYMFLPADTLNERGVVIKYQDSTIPIRVAREKFENGELKDSAAKCRQALECIVGKLWKRTSPYVGGISVQLRNLEAMPDLSQVVAGLCKATKSKEITGIEEIHHALELLQQSRSWSLLNKGTHADDSLPEFSRGEIKDLLELIEKLNDEVKKLKVKPAIVVKK